MCTLLFCFRTLKTELKNLQIPQEVKNTFDQLEYTANDFDSNAHACHFKVFFINICIYICSLCCFPTMPCCALGRPRLRQLCIWEKNNLFQQIVDWLSMNRYVFLSCFFLIFNIYFQNSHTPSLILPLSPTLQSSSRHLPAHSSQQLSSPTVLFSHHC